MQNIYFKVQHLDKPAVHTPGLCDFFFAKHEDVFFWPTVNPQTGTYTEGITLKEGATWYRCQTVDADSEYSEVQKNDAAGDYIEVSLEGIIPDDSPANSLSFAALPYYRYVIVLRERNKIMKLLGSKDVGVRFSRQYTSQDAEGARGNKLVFTWKSPVAPRIYLTAVAATGEVINPPWVGEGGVEVDPTVGSHIKAITQNNINNWNAAFGWGNHATAGYLKKEIADNYYALKNHTHSWETITGKPSDIDFIVDRPGSPVNGTYIYTNALLAGKEIRLFRSGGIKKTVVGYTVGDGYTQPDNTGKIIVIPAWEPNEIISIEIVK